MGFLDKLFGRKGETAMAPPEERPAGTAVEEAPCPHGSLVPRWDQPADMGKSELVSTYVCESCGSSFSREEGERLMAAAGQAVRLPEE